MSWDPCLIVGEDEHYQHEQLELLQIEDAVGCADQIKQEGMALERDQEYEQDSLLYVWEKCYPQTTGTKGR